MYRIIVIVIVASAMYQTFRRYREQRMSAVVSVLWGLFWLAVLVFGLVPNLSNEITSRLGIGRGADLFFFFSILILLYLNFLLLGRLERVKSELTELTRAIALRDAGLGESSDFKREEEERAGDK